MKRLLIILSIISTGLLLNKASAQTNQTVKHGAYTTAIDFPATGCSYTWTNDAPGIGLPSRGSGNIMPFIAQNDSDQPVTATITAKPSGSCAILKVKILVIPAIPAVKAAGGPVTLTTVYGDASQPVIFNVSGENLHSAAVIKAPQGFELSTNGSNFSETVSLNSDNAQLSYININPDMVRNVTSGPGDYNYIANIENSISSITITPIASAALATIKINGAALKSGSASPTIPLVPGENSIEILVTAQNGATSKKYVIKVIRAGSSDATLSGLNINQGSLTPTFAASKTDYITNVYTNSVKITPVTTNADGSVKVNGVAVTSGTPSADIPLNPGINVIPVTVTAQDGITTKTYNISVNSTKSSNAGLATLNLSPNVTLSRITGTTTYTASIESTETSVTQTAVASDANATITVNGVPVVSGAASQAIPLNTAGTTIVTTVITAQDGITTQSYKVTISKSSPTNTSIAAISSVPLMYLDYISGSNNYNASVSSSETSLKLSARLTDEKATVKINGASVANANYSGPINLQPTGATIIPITVTARDGITSKTITITVKKNGSSNALISNIGLDIPSTVTQVLGTATYNTSVSPTVTAVRQVAITSDPNSTMKVNGFKVKSGEASPLITLSSSGVTHIVTVVTAEDGVHTFTYMLNVTRNGSSNTNVSGIRLNPGATLTLVAGTASTYITSVSPSAKSIRQTLLTADQNATIKVNGQTVRYGEASPEIPLNASGVTEIKTVITAQDGVSTKTVIIRVNKNVSTNTNVTKTIISPSSTLTEVGENYVTSVLPTVNSIQETINTEDPQATITVNGVPVLPGVPSNPITLNATGTTIITNKITAPDGVSTKTYTVIISKNGSTVASVDQLYLSPSAVLMPVAGTDNFTASVGANINTVKQIVIPDDEHAHVFINNLAVASGTASGLITLDPAGKTVIRIKVVAEDGITTKTFTVTVTRGSNGDLLSPLNTALAPTPVFVRLAANANAGNYNNKVTISSVDAADGYLSLEKCVVQPAPLKITVPSATKQYGQELKNEAKSTKFIITAGNLKNGNTIDAVAISYDPVGRANATAGFYAAAAVPSSAIGDNGFSSNNYDITYQGADINVNPVKLRVKADDIVKDFGVANPALTVTYNGFVNNEGPDDLPVKPLVTTTAVMRSAIGQYTITVSGAASPNYLFAYEPGVLTVSAEHLQIFVPNTITPNGDGINDTWNIKNIDAYPNTTVEVFNRQGQKVFSSIGYGTPWDGSYKGTLLPSGTYYYFVKNEARVLSGSITLIL